MLARTYSRAWVGTVLVAASAGCALAPSAPALAAAPPRCPPASARAIAHDRSVRVYTLGARTPASTRIEACLVGRGTHMTLLAPAKGSPLHRSLGSFAFAGTKLAYVEDQFGVDSGSLSIVVADVARRRVLRTLRGVGGYVHAGVLGSSNVADVVLSAKGSVAWITETHGPPGTPGVTVAVHAATTTGAVTTLDEGPDIEAGSLSLSSGMLGWRRAGVARNAPLP